MRNLQVCCVYFQGLPLAEVNLTAGTVSVAFEDTQGQESDASSTQLKLRGQKLDVLLELMQGAVATKVGSCWLLLKIWHQFLSNHIRCCRRRRSCLQPMGDHKVNV